MASVLQAVVWELISYVTRAGVVTNPRRFREKRITIFVFRPRPNQMMKNRMFPSFHLLLLSIVGSLVYHGVIVTSEDSTGEDEPEALMMVSGMQTKIGSYIVQYREDVGYEVGDELTTDLLNDKQYGSGGTIQYKYREIFQGVSIVNVTNNATVAALRAADFVESVWEDAYLELDFAQYHPLNWGLDRIDDRELPMNGQYHYRLSGRGTEIYILDTGLYLDHTEFEPINDANKQADRPPAKCGYDVFGDNCEDEVGHGTYVAAIAAGSNYGVAKKASVIAVKIHSHRKGGASIATAISGMEYVILQKTNRPEQPMVVNFSLSGPSSEILDNAVDALVAESVVVVVSAGNRDNDSCAYSPASAGGAIVVSATDYQDAKAPYANYGDCVTVYAPGHQIPSAWIRDRHDQVFLSGTSAAAAHVTGGKTIQLTMLLLSSQF
jgi:subtilisin family serine protease